MTFSRVVLGTVLVVTLFISSCAPVPIEPETDSSPAPGSTATSPPADLAYPLPPIEAEAGDVGYPPPQPTGPPTFTPGPPIVVPTMTQPPAPTPLPTPQVTPIPTSAPPVIPTLQGEGTDPFTILFEQEGTLKITDGNGDNQMVLFDPATSSLSLLSGIPIREWVGVHPAGHELAVALDRTPASAEQDKQLQQVSIYLVEPRSGNLSLLVENATEPVWSPDGNYLAYRSTETAGLWVLDVKAETAVEIYPVDTEKGHYATQFSWAPDSKRLVFLDRVFRQSDALIVAGIDQPGAARELLDLSSHFAYCPQWSPTADRISFVSSFGESDGPNLAFNLWLVDPDGTNQQQLTKNIDVLAGGPPHWSPDGSWIVFGATPYYEEAEPLVDLWLANASGTALMRLTENASLRANETNAMWSPDGELILFLRDMSAVERYWLMSGVRHGLPVQASDFIVVPFAWEFER